MSFSTCWRPSEPQHTPSFHWRPQLPDPDDEMILELAVKCARRCHRYHEYPGLSPGCRDLGWRSYGQVSFYGGYIHEPVCLRDSRGPRAGSIGGGASPADVV